MPVTQALAENEIRERLSGLSGWIYEEKRLQKVYTAKTYLEALDWVHQVGQLAERENHHPDLLLHYKTLTVQYWTHTAKGVTELDFEQATKVERLLSKTK